MSGFQEVEKETSVVECVNSLTHSHEERNMTRLPNAAKIHLILTITTCNKNEFQSVQDSQETEEGLVMFKFKTWLC